MQLNFENYFDKDTDLFIQDFFKYETYNREGALLVIGPDQNINNATLSALTYIGATSDFTRGLVIQEEGKDSIEDLKLYHKYDLVWVRVPDRNNPEVTSPIRRSDILKQGLRMAPSFVVYPELHNAFPSFWDSSSRGYKMLSSIQCKDASLYELAEKQNLFVNDNNENAFANAKVLLQQEIIQVSENKWKLVTNAIQNNAEITHAITSAHSDEEVENNLANLGIQTLAAKIKSLGL